MITITQQIAMHGISLEMKACISAEALQDACADSAPAEKCARIQVELSEIDPAPLQGVMPPLLVQALQELRVCLAEQACQSLLAEIENRSI